MEASDLELKIQALLEERPNELKPVRRRRQKQKDLKHLAYTYSYRFMEYYYNAIYKEDQTPITHFRLELGGVTRDLVGVISSSTSTPDRWIASRYPNRKIERELNEEGDEYNLYENQYSATFIGCSETNTLIKQRHETNLTLRNEDSWDELKQYETTQLITPKLLVGLNQHVNNVGVIFSKFRTHLSFSEFDWDDGGEASLYYIDTKHRLNQLNHLAQDTQRSNTANYRGLVHLIGKRNRISRYFVLESRMRGLRNQELTKLINDYNQHGLDEDLEREMGKLTGKDRSYERWEWL